MDDDVDMGFDDFSLGLTFGDISAPPSNVSANNTNVTFSTPRILAPGTHSGADEGIASSTIDSAAKSRVKEPAQKRISVPIHHVTVVASPEDFNATVSHKLLANLPMLTRPQ